MAETSQAAGSLRGTAMKPRRARNWVALAAAAASLVAGAILYASRSSWRGGPRTDSIGELGAPAPAASGTSTSGTPAPTASRPSDAGTDAGDREARGDWKARLLHAQARLANYKRWAQYPPGARPASEQPDRLFPTAPVTRSLPLAKGGVPNPHVKVRLFQDRLALVGQESARLSVRCEDEQGAVLPCSVISGKVESLVRSGDPGGPGGFTPVTFADDGKAGDEKAGDGTFTATVQPGRLGMRQKPGPLLVTCSLRIGGEDGDAMFDLFYTPEPPAVLTGKVREAVEQGSLVLYYGIEVRTAGRYVLSARVDDANGKPLALLEWNDPLEAGAHEVKLVLFGKLLRDLAPAMPLRMRDLDGFLLKEDADPDREHVPMLAGYHHTTSTYPLTAFSSEEWSSEQRDRNLQEYERDVEETRRRLELPPPPPPP